jgi:hypothetical protein
MIRQSYIETRHLMQDQFCEADEDPLIGLRNIPGKDGIFENREFRTTVHFNRLGFRGPDISLDHRSERRLLFLGGSLTVGWGVEDQETFAALLQKAFPQWQILNAAVAGHSTRNEWGVLAKYGDRFKPTDVILTFYPNDPIVTSFPSFSQRPSEIPKPGIRSYLWELVRAVRKPKTEPWPYYFGINREQWSRCVSYLDLIRSWCRIHRTRFLLVYIPYKDELGEPHPVGYRRKVLIYCQEQQVACIDMTPFLAAVPRDAGYYAIDEHLTPLGHAIVAEHLQSGLKNTIGPGLRP